jgi:hypothetical protein
MKLMLAKMFILIIGTVLFTACRLRDAHPENHDALKQRGDAVAQAVQQELITNVTRAIERGGTAYAVDFCNTEAMSLTDSMSELYGVQVQRITGRNRNLANVLKTKNDQDVYRMFSEQNDLKDTLLLENGRTVFYKRIQTAMPVCLGCHGNPQTDINAETLRKIQLFYPNDLATGYSLNEFRAMWKITFPEE